MDSATEDAAEYHPEKGARSVERADDRPEHRPETCDIEELNDDHFPERHLDIVNAVLPGHDRGGS